MSLLTYVIGEPGVGKSTAVNGALAGLDFARMDLPFQHHWLTAGASTRLLGAYLGRRDGLFQGTDGLSLSVQPRVLDWLRQYPTGWVIAEGDRLANTSFFRAVEDIGWTLHVVALVASDCTLDVRRAERGTHQNPTWLAGRRTKVRNLIADPAVRELVDADRPPDDVADSLRAVFLQAGAPLPR
jgi:hypothetical protein